MYPRARLDALSDAIFGVAMTLLVLDVRLPEEFHAQNASQLIEALWGLLPKFVPYVLSFLVLGLRWLSTVQLRSQAEGYGRDYTGWWLFYLLLITCVPLTTIIVGRFGNFAPAIWLYAGNTALLGLVAFRLMARTPDLKHDEFLRDRQASQAVLIAASLLAIAVSFVAPRQALWAFLLNFASPQVNKLLARKAT
jgi:uncharacterized membrane protein